MRLLYRVFFEPGRGHSLRTIRSLVQEFDGFQLLASGTMVTCREETVARALFNKAVGRGFVCSFDIAAEYEREDAVNAQAGLVLLGPANTDGFRAVLPKDAFDPSTGCGSCGLGARQVKSHVLSAGARKCPANFYAGNEGGRLFLRAEIGRELIEVTGRPGCLRHPTTRRGEVIKEWMEVVPCGIMPPLSTKSKGVLIGSSTALSSVGEGPRSVPGCPECRRNVWANSFETPPRLVYSREAIATVQDQVVVEMREPHDTFPSFDSRKRVFKDLYGLPELIFSRTAIQVLVKYMQTEHIRDSAYVQPVFGE